MEKENEKSTLDISLKNILLAGVGAVAVMGEKSKDLFEELAVKGEEAIQKGKVLNEALKHKVEDTIKENVEIKVVKEELNNADDIMEAISNLSAEELELLKEKLAELKSGKGSKED